MEQISILAADDRVKTMKAVDEATGGDDVRVSTSSNW